jgi:hypothetical protein
MIAITCPKCGKALLWHLAHEHRCDKQPQNIRPKRNPKAKPVPQTASSSSPSPSSRRINPQPRNLTDDGNLTRRNLTHCHACGQPLPEAVREKRRRYMADYRARQKGPE